MQKLLDPDSLTQYVFKRRKPTRAFSNPSQQPQARSPVLSPFAKMVFQSTSAQYRYLTPESSEPDVEPVTNGAVPLSRVKMEELYINGYATPNHLQPTPSSQQRTVQAVLPSMVTPARRAEYQVVPDQDSLAGAQYQAPSNRRETIAVSAPRNLNVEQRHKGELAVQNLQNLLLEIFEAEDQLQPDTSGVVSVHATTVFAVRDTADGSVPVLQPDVQSKLESCIAKVVSNGRLHDIEIEHLAHAQKLCEGAAAAVESLTLQVGDEWAEQDVEEWLMKLGIAETGLIAARTLMRVMIGGAQQKELQSEDFLRETLDALKNVIEGCIVIIVEEPAASRERIRGEKGGPPPNPKFVIASAERKAVVALLNAAMKGMRLLGELLLKTDLDESSISSVEYLCKSLIFAENASTERESALGVQNFENMRRCAMDVLAKIFTKHTEQRQFIFDEILTSLRKLPATKQSARQYRLADAKPIQLVSALLMRLVQTSATPSNDALKLRSEAKEDEQDDDDSDETSEEDHSDDEDNIKVSSSKANADSHDLPSIVKPLHDAAQSNAFYIISILVKQAINTSKSSDEPYRRLLDIFTDDFLNVFGSSDWPAAELLLRALVMQMIGIIDRESSSVPSRTLALELIGTMGSGILELQIAAHNAAQSIDTSDSSVARRLRHMVKQIEAGNLDTHQLVAFDGPCRILIEYLAVRDTAEDAQLQTARGYHLMQWAFSVTGERAASTDSDASDTPRSSKDLQSKLKNMLIDPKWLDEYGGFDHLSTAEGRLSAMIVTLHSKFCKAFNKMFSILLSAMSSEQSTSTVKSKSLKSVVSMLEKDASLLDRNPYVLHHIFRCSTDSSPLVRDSALSLIEKCISLQPGLSAKVYKQLIARTNDAAIGVRRRAMNMLKDIYLRDKDKDVRSAIANAIIARIEDAEDKIIELARTTMEEIWFQPFYGVKRDGDRAVEARIAFGSQAAHMIETVEQSDGILQVLESLLKRLLSISKAAEANARVCKTLVAVLFDGIIDNNEIPGTPPQDAILRSLTVFAKASPKLFIASQLERLQPYTQNLTTSDDMEVYRSVITILRYVLPHQSMMNRETLTEMQTTLLTSVTKLHKTELAEVATCLWTVSCLIGKTDRLAKFIISVVKAVSGFFGDDLAADQQKLLKVTKLVRMAGQFGNACDFSDFLSEFKKSCDWYKGDSVPGLIVEGLCPFMSLKRPLTVRVASLEAICIVSQAWPKQFLRTDVTNAFETVFREGEPSLEEVLLAGLEGFFKAQEVPDDAADVSELGSGVTSGTERFGRTYVASDQDGASTSMAQRFLSHVLRLALASCDELAFTAARLVVSINKQGLVHPKESGPALVALETCPNKAIANEAFREHKSQHQKHESLFEKEYMRAIQRAFDYQNLVIGDSTGFTGSPPTSKMHLMWEVLKLGKAGVRKKFLGNISQRLDFDPSKLDMQAAVPQHLLFVRFCLDNLAYFEYDKVDDLVHLLSSLEKTFAGTGSSIAQAIESEVLKLQVNVLSVSGNKVNGTSETLAADPTAPDVDSARLRQLAVAAQILTLIWETRSFLLRVWNMQKHLRPKQSAKDVSRAPYRATNAPSLTEAYLRRVNELLSPLTSEDDMRRMSSSFVELTLVDNEVKIGSDEDAEAEDVANGYDTPSERSGRSPSLPPSGSGRGRKRKPSSANITPRKRGRPSLGKRKSTSSKYAEDDDDAAGWD